MKPIHRVEDLVAAGLAKPASAAALEAVTRRYALAITPDMARLIETPDDPIARQFVPDARELETRPEELADPIGDGAHSPVAGIVHRYPDRVLLKPLHICPVYCRFCFRREMVGPGVGQMLSAAEIDAALAYVAERPAIWEVILTGGDPLALSPRRLGDLMRRIGAIAHVKVVRVHTRVPAVDPSRVDADLIAALKASGKTAYVALHANHARELGAEAGEAVARIVDAGVPMVSQTVLLKGVNDDAQVLAALMRRFVELRVKPYYLHHPDLAPGTSHFRVDLETGRAIVHELRRLASGLCQPAYVLDIPGGFGKAPVGPNHVTDEGVVDHRGVVHPHPSVARKPESPPLKPD